MGPKLGDCSWLDKWGVKKQGATADSPILGQHHNAGVICKAEASS